MNETKEKRIQARLNPIRVILAGVILLSISSTTIFVMSRLNPSYIPIELTGDFGTVLAPPQQVDNFTLTDTSGNPLQLSDLEGNYTLLSFGYTHCPDVCPLTLTEYRRVKRDLGDMAENVNFVFVSVDGERDTPELLNRYLGRFDPAFIGLTTDDDSLMQTIASDFNVFYEKREIEGTQAGYMVDHTASLFLLNPRGEVIVLYPFGTPPVDIAADIRALVS